MRRLRSLAADAVCVALIANSAVTVALLALGRALAPSEKPP